MNHSFADEAAMLDESRRERQERRDEMDAQARADIEGHVFLYRNAMDAFLRSALRVRLGRSLSIDESQMVTAVAITLWGEHALQYGINVKIVTEEMHQLVTKAQAQRVTAPRNLSLHETRRRLGEILPESITPSDDRKLERRST